LFRKLTPAAGTATYTFSRTEKVVVNTIKGVMRFKDGKIIEHSERFPLSTWAAPALGWNVCYLAWTGFMISGIQKKRKEESRIFLYKAKSEP
jgi:hypothetical protein